MLPSTFLPLEIYDFHAEISDESIAQAKRYTDFRDSVVDNLLETFKDTPYDSRLIRYV